MATPRDTRINWEWRLFLLFVANREVVISSFLRKEFLNDLEKFTSEYLECISDSFLLDGVLGHNCQIELLTIIKDVKGVDTFFLEICELLVLDQFGHISFELSLQK